MTDTREQLGRLVHQVRTDNVAEINGLAGRERFILPPWEKRTAGQRELDMRIADAIVSAVLGGGGTPLLAPLEMS